MGFGDIMKNGWHPEKAAAGASSSSSSGRSSSMVPKSFGLGKFGGSSASSSNYDASARVPSKPVSELTDAKLFPPPPKHREFHPDAGSAVIAPEYVYLYQPALERKQQDEQRQQQQQHLRQTWQPGQTPPYQAQGQPQYQQPGHVPGQPAYQQPAAAQLAQPTYQQPAYQQSQQTYQSPPPQQAYQSPNYQPPQQTYQPPAHPTPSAQSPPLPQRGPMPSLPPRNGSTPPFQQPSNQPPQQQQQPAYRPPQQQPAYQQPQQQPANQPPQQQQQQPAYRPPQQQPAYQPPQQAPAYQSPQQPPAPVYQQPTVTPSYQSQPDTPSYQQPTQPFVRGHGYSQSVADGRSPSVSPPLISQPTPRYPNFASEISRARAGLSSASPAPPLIGQRVPSGHRHTQSTSVVGKKAPPPPPKPKNPALRGSPTSPVVGQSPFPGAFPENGIAESNMNNNTETRSGPPDRANVPAKPSGLMSGPISTPKPPPASTPAVVTQQPAQTQWTPPQVDLELDKKWYAMGNNPMKLLQLPAFLSGRTYASTIAIAGNTKTIMLSVRFPDLSRTKFRIEVDRYDDNNVSAQRVDFPPPGRPSASDLDAAATSFGENVAKFVEANIGRQIGNGECWTVANESLKASGAMESCGFIHGVEIWSSNPATGARSGDEEMLRRGDILQFKSARFRSSGPSGRRVEEKYVGAPDHTAVIVAVHSAAPIVVTVLEQNVGGVRSVQQGSYVFSEMTDGSVAAYRPFWKEWAGELDTSWP
ncbi:hypothetical protein V1505DRAFT_360855 [Lipomyces doorenjongii]